MTQIVRRFIDDNGQEASPEVAAKNIEWTLTDAGAVLDSHESIIRRWPEETGVDEHGVRWRGDSKTDYYKFIANQNLKENEKPK